MSFSRAGRGHSKPAAGLQIDWTHPLAKGLVLCIPLPINGGIPPVDLCNPSQSVSVINGAPNLIVWHGGSLNFPGGSGPEVSTTMGVSLASSALSWSCVFSEVTFGALGVFILGNVSATDKCIILMPTSATNLDWRQVSDTFSVTVPNMTNRRVHAVGTMNTAKGQTFYVDGKLISTRTAGGLFTGSQFVSIPSSLVIGPIPCSVEHLMFWNRVLSKEDAAWLYQEPYAMFFSGIKRRFGPQPTQISPAFIADDSQVFTPAVLSQVTPGFIADSSQVFTPAVASQLTPGFIADSSQVFTPAVKSQVTPGFIADSSQVFTPAVNSEVTPGFIADSSQVFTPALESQVTPAFIPDSSQVFTPALASELTPAFIPDSSQVFTPALESQVTPDFIPDDSQVFSPSIDGKINPDFIPDDSQVFTPALASQITPAFIPDSSQVFTPAVGSRVTPAFIPDSSQVFTPTISVASPGGQSGGGWFLWNPDYVPPEVLRRLLEG